jgi:hypothetical protein
LSTIDYSNPEKWRTLGYPDTQIRVHKPGKINMTITNWGQLGSEYDDIFIDPETGLKASSCEYPAGSGIEYLFFGSLWLGAIVEADTLVSIGVDGWHHIIEFYPDNIPYGAIVKRSSLPEDPDYNLFAISEADYIATYYDTLTDPMYTGEDPYDSRPHIPLGLKVVQSSYSWSTPAYEDFIIFRYEITNIRENILNDL